MIPLLAKVSFGMSVVAFLWVLTAVALILIILAQKGKGGGLGAAFGGSMNTLLGSKTGDFLTWFTIGLTAMMLFLTVVMVKFYKPASELPTVKSTMTTPQPGQEQPPVLPAEGDVDNTVNDAENAVNNTADDVANVTEEVKDTAEAAVEETDTATAEN